jgi:hypothetical protein
MQQKQLTPFVTALFITVFCDFLIETVAETLLQREININSKILPILMR